MQIYVHAGGSDGSCGVSAFVEFMLLRVQVSFSCVDVEFRELQLLLVLSLAYRSAVE